jgi:predicted transcriptional regulator
LLARIGCLTNVLTELENRYNGWYTPTVKTAVSLPNEVFQAAERLARERGLTRSSLYAQALEAFLEANEIDPLTEAINRVADRADTRLDPGLKRLQEATLERNT